MAFAADYHVAQNGQDPQWPYTNWITAASNIQDALNAAGNGDTVWVDDGIYLVPTNALIETTSTNVVSLTNALTMRSVNGADSTIIDGGGSNRCMRIHLTAAVGATGPTVIDGFTFTNGYDTYRGAGIYIIGSAGGTSIVQNCVITDNILEAKDWGSDVGGGGVHARGAGFASIISNCTVRANQTITRTVTRHGAGIWYLAEGMIVDCLIAANVSSGSGGGIRLATYPAIVDRCVIVSNTAAYGGGAIISGGDPELRNSLFAYNIQTGSGGSGVYGYNALKMYNCTVVSNSPSQVYLRSSVTIGDLQNNIMQTIAVHSGAVTGYNNCMPEVPGNGEWHDTLEIADFDNVKFVDPGNGNFRLQAASPCINAGINQSWTFESLDLDRKQRADRFSGITDMGCFEYLPRGALLRLR